MGKKSIVVGIGQLALIVLVWMLNPKVMVEQIGNLLLVFGIGCVTGVIAPSMLASTKNGRLVSWGKVFEIMYVVAFGVLLRLVQYNIVI